MWWRSRSVPCAQPSELAAWEQGIREPKSTARSIFNRRRVR
jgi:hypothetical protein